MAVPETAVQEELPGARQMVRIASEAEAAVAAAADAASVPRPLAAAVLEEAAELPAARAAENTRAISAQEAVAEATADFPAAEEAVAAARRPRLFLMVEAVEEPQRLMQITEGCGDLTGVMMEDGSRQMGKAVSIPTAIPEKAGSPCIQILTFSVSSR